MKIPPAPKLLPVIPILCGLAASLPLAGCGDDDPASCPPYEIGVIEGTVTSAGEGLAALVEFESRDEDNPLRSVPSVRADSTGHYRCELPTGSYRFRVREIDGDYISFDSRDTLRILPGFQRRDLCRGRVEIRFTLPETLEGETVHIRLREVLTNFTMGLRSTVGDGLLAGTFPLVPPGDYRMEFSAGSTGQFYLPATVDRDEAVVLPVGDETPVRYELDLRPFHSSLAGRVTGSWLLGGSNGLTVTARTAQDNALARVDCGREDGSFRFDLFVSGQVRLRTEYDEILGWIGGESLETARTFDLEPGVHLSGLDLVESGLRVRLEGPGEVFDHEAEILLRDDNGLEFEPWRNYRSPFVLCNLRPGRWYLYLEGACEDQLWAPQWFGGGQDFAGAVPIDLAPGELREIVVDLVEGGRIQGRLRVPDGAGITEVAYRLYDGSGEVVCGWQQWSGGGFRYTGLPDDTYRIAAEIPDNPSWYYPGTWAAESAAPITITDHGTMTGIEWDLPDILVGGDDEDRLARRGSGRPFGSVPARGRGLQRFHRPGALHAGRPDPGPGGDRQPPRRLLRGVDRRGPCGRHRGLLLPRPSGRAGTLRPGPPGGGLHRPFRPRGELFPGLRLHRRGSRLRRHASRHPDRR